MRQRNKDRKIEEKIERIVRKTKRYITSTSDGRSLKK